MLRDPRGEPALVEPAVPVQRGAASTRMPGRPVSRQLQRPPMRPASPPSSLERVVAPTDRRWTPNRDPVEAHSRDLRDREAEDVGKLAVAAAAVRLVGDGLDEREAREHARAVVVVEAGQLAGEHVASEQRHERDKALRRVTVGQRLDMRGKPKALAAGERHVLAVIGERDRVHALYRRQRGEVRLPVALEIWRSTRVARPPRWWTIR